MDLLTTKNMCLLSPTETGKRSWESQKCDNDAHIIDENERCQMMIFKYQLCYATTQ